MKSIGLLFFLILSINSQQIYECDFDYGLKCLPGLPSASLILLNETSEEPRQPASDVTAIETSNDQGECFFPFPVSSFEMYFCEQNDPGLPATCPTFNATGPRINCSEGEYGYEKFEAGEAGSRSHKLDLSFDLLTGKHCIRFYYYLSDQNSNGSVKVIVEDSGSNTNETIVIASSRSQNRWHQIREDFLLYNENPTIYFVFERESSLDSLPFYIAIDEITITDIECGPVNTTTTGSSSSTSQTTVSITSSILPNITLTSTTSNPFSNSTTTSTMTTSVLLTASTSQSTSSTTASTSGTSSVLLSTTTQSTTVVTTSTTSETITTSPSSSTKIRSNIFLIILFLLFIRQ